MHPIGWPPGPRFYTDILPGLALVLVAAVVVLALGVWWYARRPERRALARRRQGLRGEEQAIPLLERAGYTVLATQHGGNFHAEVDGQPWTYPLRADLLVRRKSDGALWIAEVKTGTVAPLLTHGPTRRQLLEYTLAFRHEVEGALLVAPETGEVTCVRFPVLAPLVRGSRSAARLRLQRWGWLLLGVGLGGGLYAAAELVWPWFGVRPAP